MFPDTFKTYFGYCTLEIYGGRVEDIPEIVQLLKDESVILVEELGEVTLRTYSIYITSNINRFIYNKIPNTTSIRSKTGRIQFRDIFY